MEAFVAERATSGTRGFLALRQNRTQAKAPLKLNRHRNRHEHSTDLRRFARVMGRLLRIVVLVVLGLVLLPYAVTPLYLLINPVSTPMLFRWVTGQRMARTFVPLDAMTPSLPLTVLTAEDARFCRHIGVDWKEMSDAMERAEELGDIRGASTITQQTAKNLFLWGGRSFVRKALEFPLALWIDLILPKRRILEIYLNIAEWGPNGEFGAEAGSRRAFGKSARDLSAREAALMAAILPNPIRRSAGAPRAGVQRLAGIYQSRAANSPAVGACLYLRRTPSVSRSIPL
jgi:monofunctional biosynthetic peptidoglycan transglycosylase